MYKVFFNDRTIYLDDDLPDMNVVGKDYVCAFENKTDLRPQVKQFLDPRKKGDLYIYHDNKEDLLKTFRQCFTNIDASGGLVRNARGELLVIFRRGRWDLPKGKAEKGERSAETALREVREECGLQELELEDHIATTYHLYLLNEDFVLKKTEWYGMTCEGEEQLRPNIAEDITEAKWAGPVDMDEILSNTYPSIRELIMAPA